MKKKKIVIIVSIIILALLVGVLCYIKFNDKKTEEPNNPVKEEDSYVIISINPKLMLKLNNKVIKEIYTLNDDSNIFVDKDIEGSEVSEGTKKIFDILLNNNYIKEDTVINLRAYKYIEETKELVEDIDSLYENVVSQTFIENGIIIKPYEITNEEKSELVSLIKNEILDKEENNDKEENSEDNNEPVKPIDNNVNNNTEVKPITNDNKEETPKPKEKLDISNIFERSFSAKMYVKINEINRHGFESVLAYYKEEQRKCNNGEVDLSEYEDYGNGLVCNPRENYCDQVKNWVEGIAFDDYNEGYADITIYENEGLIYSFPTDWGGTYPCFAGGAGMGAEGFFEVKVTSDTDYYYIESEPFGKCTITQNFDMTCEKSPLVDEYTGKTILTFKAY